MASATAPTTITAAQSGQADHNQAASHAHEVAVTVADRFRSTWLDGDADGYGALFTDDADYVIVDGTHLAGRDAITGGIGHVFGTVYLDSTVDIEVLSARTVAPSVVVAQLRHVVDAPALPDPEPMVTVATAVITDTDGGPLVAAFHNTLVAEG